jgi:predicted ATP-grasp superfamily ATP-dependent carboligase
MAVLIFGASVRAARQSALRAGIASVGCDLFADRDNPPHPPTARIESADYPLGFERIAHEMSRSRPWPWMYTGGLENHPELIDRIAAIRPLWGIGGASLRSVRDPIAVADCLSHRGLPAPGVRRDPEGLPRDGSWLSKPLASAGGRKIGPWIGTDAKARPSYYQERIDGPSLAAIFVGRSSGPILIGVTRQRIGRDGNPFAYAGSLGPWQIEPRVGDTLVAIGQTLVEAFRLRGLFGVDFVLRDDGVPFPVEVNPRYTASVEVLELATGCPMMPLHRRAFEDDGPCEIPATHRPPRSIVGKAILFADRRSTFPPIDLDGRDSGRRAVRERSASSLRRSWIADVPAEGLVFDAGDPVLTVMARAPTLKGCELLLKVGLMKWRSRLADAPA